LLRTVARPARNVNDTKNGKRREMMARLSFNTACELGFRGSLNEWERAYYISAMKRIARRGISEDAQLGLCPTDAHLAPSR